MGDFWDFDLDDRISCKRTTMNAKASSLKIAPAVGTDVHLTFSPTPRPVRMKRYARVFLSFLVLLVIVDVGYFVLPSLQVARSQKVSLIRDPGNLIVMVSIPLLAALYLFTLFRHRTLLRDGSVVIGCITEIRTGSWYIRGGYAYGRVAVYEFTDPSMQVVHGEATDRDHSAHQGLAMPVFYDSNDSRHNLPLCSSFYELSPKASVDYSPPESSS
jgi:hypothetical protein